MLSSLNPLMPGGNEMSYILKQTGRFFVAGLLKYVYDLLLPPGIKELLI